MGTPLAVVREWFDAWSSGDMDEARALLAPGAHVLIAGREMHGFDALAEWYRRRAASSPGFGYRVVDLLGGERHAAAVIEITDGTRSWQQVALYEVRDETITRIWAVEDAPSESPALSPEGS